MRESGCLDRKIETASLQEVRRLQDAKLAKQLDYLFARSLFYQEKFQAAGMRRPQSKQFRPDKRSLGPHSLDPKAFVFATNPRHASAQSRRDRHEEARALAETRSVDSISE